MPTFAELMEKKRRELADRKKSPKSEITQESEFLTCEICGTRDETVRKKYRKFRCGNCIQKEAERRQLEKARKDRERQEALEQQEKLEQVKPAEEEIPITRVTAKNRETIPDTLAIARSFLSLSGLQFNNTAVSTKTKAKRILKRRLLTPEFLGEFVENVGKYMKKLCEP